MHAMDKYEVIGSCIEGSITNPPFKMIFGDLIVQNMLDNLIDESKPDAVIHCAALANVDQCERDQDLAFRLNAELPGKLAKLTSKLGLKLVQISTDSVFDGKTGNYVESDITNPLNIYAKSKLAGEENVAKNDPDAIIARVNFFGWSMTGQRSLAEWFFNNLSDNCHISGFSDVFFNPLEVMSLAKQLLALIEKDLSGIYHVASPNFISKYEFGRQIANLFGFDDSLISPQSWRSAGLSANRATNATLSINKLVNDLGMVPPTVQESLSFWHDSYIHGYPQKLRSFA